MKPQTLSAALKTGDVATAIALLRPWLLVALPGEAELLVHSAPPGIRHHLCLLMLDLLSQWPQTILGAPVQLFAARSTNTPPNQTLFEMPASPSCIVPVRGLVFLGWIDKGTTLALPSVKIPSQFIAIDRMVSLVALFRTQPELEIDNLKIPENWWARLFAGSNVDAYFTAHTLQPYPIALETCRLLDDAANGKDQSDNDLLFVTQSQVDWAIKTGPVFREEGERHIPNFSGQMDWLAPQEYDDI